MQRGATAWACPAGEARFRRPDTRCGRRRGPRDASTHDRARPCWRAPRASSRGQAIGVGRLQRASPAGPPPRPDAAHPRGGRERPRGRSGRRRVGAVPTRSHWKVLAPIPRGDLVTRDPWPANHPKRCMPAVTVAPDHPWSSAGAGAYEVRVPSRHGRHRDAGRIVDAGVARHRTEKHFKDRGISAMWNVRHRG